MTATGATPIRRIRTCFFLGERERFIIKPRDDFNFALATGRAAHFFGGALKGALYLAEHPFAKDSFMAPCFGAKS